MNNPPCYYETIIWEYDPETKKRGKMLNMMESGGYERAALKKHFGIVMELSKTIKELEPEDIEREEDHAL